MSSKRFRAVPLTPVHIGCGERLAPEDYFLEAERLVRFNPHAVLAGMPDAERRRYESLLEAGRLGEALTILRRHAQDRRCWLYEEAISAASLAELRQAVMNPRRKGEIHALPRNPYTGEVILPGSAIKGAIRTALLSACVNDANHPDRTRFAGELAAARRRNSKAAPERLEELGFRMQKRDTATDPLGLLKVADGTAPASAARIDKPILHRLGRDDASVQGVQLHVERLLSRADGLEPPGVELTVILDEAAAKKRLERDLVKFHLNWEFIARACNCFFTGRLRAELERFPEVRRHAAAWAPRLGPDEILLRAGRFCHFDSLSVDGFREGWNAQARRPIREIGSTRTLCETISGVRAPFGWILLRRVDGV